MFSVWLLACGPQASVSNELNQFGVFKSIGIAPGNQMIDTALCIRRRESHRCCLPRSTRLYRRYDMYLTGTRQVEIKGIRYFGGTQLVIGNALSSRVVPVYNLDVEHNVRGVLNGFTDQVFADPDNVAGMARYGIATEGALG